MFGPRKQILILLLCVLALTAWIGAAAPKTASPTIYATVGGALEPDTCASAWAIKRFVDTGAVFRFHPPNTTIEEGIQFDTPGAKQYARRPNQSIMETVIQVHGLDDPALLRIARIVRDIEINKWGERLTPESAGVVRIMRGLSQISKDEDECLARSFVLYDALYADFKAESE